MRTYVRTYRQTYIHTYRQTDIQTHTHTYTHRHTHIHTYTHPHIHTHACQRSLPTWNLAGDGIQQRTNLTWLRTWPFNLVYFVSNHTIFLWFFMLFLVLFEQTRSVSLPNWRAYMYLVEQVDLTYGNIHPFGTKAMIRVGNLMFSFFLRNCIRKRNHVSF